MERVRSLKGEVVGVEEVEDVARRSVRFLKGYDGASLQKPAQGLDFTHT